MEITEHGLKDVQKALESALKREAEARQQLDDASERVDALREAAECKHKESDLENTGSFMYMQTRCKKCGFTWMD